MSVNKFSNFSMPSLNGLVDINADNIDSDVINTDVIFVNGVDIAQQIQANAQKLTAISYTPTTTTISSDVLIPNGNLDITGEIYLRNPAYPTTQYMRMFNSNSFNGFAFRLESPNQILYFQVKDGFGNYRSFQFSYNQIYNQIFFNQDNDMNIGYAKYLFFGDYSSFAGGGIRYIPSAGDTVGFQFMNYNNNHYTNFYNRDTGGNDIQVFRIHYDQVASLVSHLFSGSAVFNGTVYLNSNILANSATITPTELSYIDGLNSNAQNQLNQLAPKANPVFSGTANFVTILASSNVNTNTLNVFLTSNLNGATNLYSTCDFYDVLNMNSTARFYLVSSGITISQTELSYLDNVSSNIQTQLNAKAPSNNTSLTGITTIQYVNFIDPSTSKGMIISPQSILNQTNGFVGAGECLISTNTSNNSSLVLTTSNNTLSYGLRLISTSSTTASIRLAVGTGVSLIVNQAGTTINGNCDFGSGGTVTYFTPNVSFLFGYTSNGAISQTSTTATDNKISQTIIVGDTLSNQNEFKYTNMRYNVHSASGSANPVLNLRDNYTNNQIMFVPNISNGSFNSINSLNNRTIVAVSPSIDNAAITVTTWSTQKNGLKVSVTSSTNTQTELWANTSSIVLNSTTGVALTGVSSVTYTGGKTVDGNYGNIYTATLTTTTLTTGVDVNVSSALSLPAGTYSIHWNCTFHTINGSTTVYGYGGCYTTSTSFISDATIFVRGYNGTTVPVDQYFSTSGSTVVSFASATSIYLRSYCVFGTAGNIEFNSGSSSLKAIKLC
jgi:hypothetical protein